jgi:hypothetical protein
MARKSLHQFINSISRFMGLLLLVVVLVFVLNDLPKTMPASVYPPPEAFKPIVVLTQTETTDISKLFPHSTPAPALGVSPFFDRPTEVGRIIESGYSLYPSYYIFINQWFGVINNKQIMIFAGALRGDSAAGGKALPEPWPGVLVIEESSIDAKIIPEEINNYKIENTGAFRILRVDNSEILLLAKNGSYYSFSITGRVFKKVAVDQPLVRNIDGGQIFEVNRVPFPSEEYSFENYLTFHEDRLQIYVFAGALAHESSQGVLVIYSNDPISNISEGVVYKTPVKDGHARILDFITSKVVFTTLSGVVFAFDPSTGQFFTTMNGDFTPISTDTTSKPVPYSTKPGIELEMRPAFAPTISPLPTAVG